MFMSCLFFFFYYDSLNDLDKSLSYSLWGKLRKGILKFKSVLSNKADRFQDLMSSLHVHPKTGPCRGNSKGARPASAAAASSSSSFFSLPSSLISWLCLVLRAPACSSSEVGATADLSACSCVSFSRSSARFRAASSAAAMSAAIFSMSTSTFMLHSWTHSRISGSATGQWHTVSEVSRAIPASAHWWRTPSSQGISFFSPDGGPQSVEALLQAFSVNKHLLMYRHNQVGYLTW